MNHSLKSLLLRHMRSSFGLVLALYAFSALEMHEWLHVPSVVAHFLEQHTGEEFHDLFHEEHGPTQHHDDHEHDPFNEDCHGEFCACGGLVALSPVNGSLQIGVAALTIAVGAHVIDVPPRGYSGTVWNPPKA
ncbi:MAG: hypothetical protein IPK70_09920 [Flavobacteriales bacterium]|nr:hypothetical protein [Flavobacteriales bacterium]